MGDTFSISAELNSNLNNNDFFVDVSNADSIIHDIIVQFNIVEKTLNSISNDLNKMTYKKMLKGNNRFISASKKCSLLIHSFRQTITLLEQKYSDDKNAYAIRLINDRIKKLEDKINKLDVK